MKSKRQRKIRELIEEMVMETQEQLVDELKRQGFEVTQATVSRDIKELGLVKVPAGINSFRYALPHKLSIGNAYERLQRMFEDAVNAIDYSENLILIRTMPGTAMAVASLLDNLGWKEIIGTVAGDDTILVIAKPKEAVQDIIERLQNLNA